MRQIATRDQNDYVDSSFASIGTERIGYILYIKTNKKISIQQTPTSFDLRTHAG